MPTQQVAPSRQSDTHAGPESAQEEEPGPARLTSSDERFRHLFRPSERALAAMQRANYHMMLALKILTRAVNRERQVPPIVGRRLH
jgi:hypothetical protein